MSLRIDGDDITEVDEDDASEEVMDVEDDPQVIVDNTRFNTIKFDFLTVGSYVALFSPTTGFEPFYLVEVLQKGIADTRMEDEHNHTIPASRQYMLGCYYEKDNEKRSHVLYKKSKNFSNVLINMNEIASVNVDFDGMQLSKEKYVSICRDVLS